MSIHSHNAKQWKHSVYIKTWRGYSTDILTYGGCSIRQVIQTAKLQT